MQLFQNLIRKNGFRYRILPFVEKRILWRTTLCEDGFGGFSTVLSEIGFLATDV